MDALIQSAPNHVFAKSIIESFSTVNWQNFIHVLPKAIGQAGLILFVKYLFEKGNIEIFSTIYKNLFYVELTFSKGDINSINYYIAEVIAKHVKNNESKGSYNGIEINVSKNDVRITVPRFIGRFLIAGLLLEAKNAFNTYITNKNNKLTTYKKNALTLDPSDQFPSRNDLLVETMAADFFETSHCIGHKTLCMRINGKPGLGKSSLANYLAYQKICQKVIRLDLSCMVKMEFSSIVKQNFDEVVRQDTVVMLDEIDKYLDENIRIRFQNQKDVSYDDFSKNARTEFLFQVLEILEIDCMGGSLVLIICTNNFETIFSKVEMTHHRSFLDRMTVVNFEPCEKCELVKYFKFVNEKLWSTKFYVSLDRLEKILYQIKDDVQIPFRQVFFISQKNSFNYTKIVKDINEWTESDYSNNSSNKTSPLISRTNSDIVNKVSNEKNVEKTEKIEKIRQVTDLSTKDDEIFNSMTNLEKIMYMLKQMTMDDPERALNTYLHHINLKDKSASSILNVTIKFWSNKLYMVEKIVNAGATDNGNLFYDLIGHHHVLNRSVEGMGKSLYINENSTEVIRYLLIKGFCFDHSNPSTSSMIDINNHIHRVILTVNDLELIGKLIGRITNLSGLSHVELMKNFVSEYDPDGIAKKFEVVVNQFSDIDILDGEMLSLLDHFHIASSDVDGKNSYHNIEKLISILESKGATGSKIIPEELKIIHHMFISRSCFKSDPAITMEILDSYKEFIKNSEIFSRFIETFIETDDYENVLKSIMYMNSL